MSALPKFGLMCLDNPFHRALSGALMESLERQGVDLSALIILRHRSRAGRLLRGEIGSRALARFASSVLLGSPGLAGLPLDLTGYSRLVGSDAVSQHQERFARFERDQPQRILVTHDLEDPVFLETLSGLGLTLALSEGCGLLRQQLLDRFAVGVLNLHGSGPLPYYRGLGSLEFAIIDGKPVVMNLHLVDSGIDTGPIVAQQELSSAGASDLSAVYALLMRNSRDFIAKTVRQVLDGQCHPVPQQPGAGRQYFEPHPAVAAAAERRLTARSGSRVIR